MTKEAIALQLTLKLLDNFAYKAEEYGGNTLDEHAAHCANVAATIYNGIIKQI